MQAGSTPGMIGVVGKGKDGVAEYSATATLEEEQDAELEDGDAAASAIIQSNGDVGDGTAVADVSSDAVEGMTAQPEEEADGTAVAEATNDKGEASGRATLEQAKSMWEQQKSDRQDVDAGPTVDSLEDKWDGEDTVDALGDEEEEEDDDEEGGMGADASSQFRLTKTLGTVQSRFASIMDKRKLYAKELQEVAVKYLEEQIKSFMMFGKMSKTLSRKQLMNGIVTLREDFVDENEAYQIAQTVDSSKDGSVTFTEFCQAVDAGVIGYHTMNNDGNNITDPENWFLSAVELKEASRYQDFANVEQLYYKYTRSADHSIRQPLTLIRLKQSLMEEGIFEREADLVVDQLNEERRDKLNFNDFFSGVMWGLIPRNPVKAVQLQAGAEAYAYYQNDEGMVTHEAITEGMLQLGYPSDVSRFTGLVVQANMGEKAGTYNHMSLKWFMWLVSKGIIPANINGKATATSDQIDTMQKRMMDILNTYQRFTVGRTLMTQAELMSALAAGGMKIETARFFSKLPFWDYTEISAFQFASIVSYKQVLLIRAQRPSALALEKPPLVFRDLSTIAASFVSLAGNGSADGAVVSGQTTVTKTALMNHLVERHGWNAYDADQVVSKIIHSYASIKTDGGKYEFVESGAEMASKKHRLRKKCKGGQTHNLTCISSRFSDEDVVCVAPYEICNADVSREWGSQKCKKRRRFRTWGQKLLVRHGCAADFVVMGHPADYDTEDKEQDQSVTIHQYTTAVERMMIPADGITPVHRLGVVALWSVYCSINNIKSIQTAYDKGQQMIAANAVPQDRSLDVGVGGGYMGSDDGDTKVHVTSDVMEMVLTEKELRHAISFRVPRMNVAVTKQLMVFLRLASVLQANNPDRSSTERTGFVSDGKNTMSFNAFVKARAVNLLPNPDYSSQANTLAGDVSLYTMCVENSRITSLASQTVTKQSLRACLRRRDLDTGVASFLVDAVFTPFPSEYAEAGLTFEQFRYAIGSDSRQPRTFPKLRDYRRINKLMSIVEMYRAMRPGALGVPVSEMVARMEEKGWPHFLATADSNGVDTNSDGYVTFLEYHSSTLLNSHYAIGHLMDSEISDPRSVVHFMSVASNVSRAAVQDNRRKMVIRRILGAAGFLPAQVEALMSILSHREGETDRQLRQRITGFVREAACPWIMRWSPHDSSWVINVYQDWQQFRTVVVDFMNLDEERTGVIRHTTRTSKNAIQLSAQLREFGLDDSDHQWYMAIMDRNRDGLITLDEFARAVNMGMLPLKSGKGDEDGTIGREVQWLRQLFRWHDRNENKLLVEGELRRAKPSLMSAFQFDTQQDLLGRKYGTPLQLTFEQFAEETIMGGLCIRVLQISDAYNFYDDMRDYFSSLNPSQLGVVDTKKMVSRLYVKEGYAREAAQLYGQTAAMQRQQIDMSTFAGAVMRGELAIPRAKDPFFNLGSGDALHSPATDADTAPGAGMRRVASDSDVVLVRGIEVSGGTPAVAFDPQSASQAWVVMVPATVTSEVTFTFDFDAETTKVTLDGEILTSGAPSAARPAEFHQPTPLYVKAVDLQGNTRTFTIVLLAQQDRVRCTNSFGGQEVSDRPCALPFEYPSGSGKFHYECISEGYQGVDPLKGPHGWCSTTRIFTGTWGYCKAKDESCATMPPDVGSDSESRPHPATAGWDRLQQVLKAMDRVGRYDESGCWRMTTKELAIQLADLPDLSAEDAAVLAEMVDRNSDGSVDFSEMLHAVWRRLLPDLHGGPSTGKFRLVLKSFADVAEGGSADASQLYGMFDELDRTDVAPVPLEVCSTIVQELGTGDGLSALDWVRGVNMGTLPTSSAGAGLLKEGAALYAQQQGSTPANGKALRAPSAGRIKRLLVGQGVSKGHANIIGKLWSSPATAKHPFSRFLALVRAGLLPVTPADAGAVEQLMQTLDREFVDMMGGTDTRAARPVDKLTNALQDRGISEQNAKALACQATGGSGNIDIVGFVDAFVDTLLPLRRDPLMEP